jgi:putative inorganic carbon (HCO3(-)) transporter
MRDGDAVAIRDLFLFGFILGAIPFMVVHPYIGVLFWTWVGLMNPHRLTWGFAYSFQFAQLIALATLAGLIFTKDERRWKAGPEVYLLIVFLLWMSLTTFFALEPEAAFDEWKRVIKIQVMGLVALVVLHSRQHINLLIGVLAISIGYFGTKGGVFTILTGGNYRVWGPPDTYIADNNALALAVVMIIPLAYYLLMQSSRTWMKLAIGGAMALCAVSALGSQSRGALLAISAMTVFLWLHSRHKAILGMILAIGAPVLLAFMPEQWWERMGTIVHHEGEGSAESRLVAWQMLLNLANDRFFGGGFEPYTRQVWDMYMPEWPKVHSAHSIYFEVLGEHGWIGLVLFVSMWFFVWRCSRWIIRQTRDRDDLRWAHSLTSMIQVSMIGYLVGGTFLNLAYWDLPYYLLITLVVTRDFVRRTLAAAPAEAPAQVRDPGTAVGITPISTNRGALEHHASRSN